MSRVEVSRHVAADPASVALLLSEPPTVHDPQRSWIVAPPRRTGTAFVSVAQSGAPAMFAVAGELRIEPALDGGCVLRLVIDAPPAAAERAQRSASRFLATIASRARSRAYAA